MGGWESDISWLSASSIESVAVKPISCDIEGSYAGDGMSSGIFSSIATSSCSRFSVYACKE